jgi:hypothetical protein
VFDAICVRKRYVGHLRLTDRLRVAASDFVGIIPRLPTNPLLLLLKKMFAARDALYVYKELVPRLLHGNVRLSLAPRDSRATRPTGWAGVHEGQCRVQNRDLRRRDQVEARASELGGLLPGRAGGAGGHGQARGAVREDVLGEPPKFGGALLALASVALTPPQPYDLLMWLNEEERETLAGFLPSAIVVECVWDPDWFTMTSPGQGQDARWAKALPVHGGGWRLRRVRTDKEGPNDKATVKKVWQSILDQVGEEELALALRV